MLRRKRVGRITIDGRVMFLHRYIIEQRVGRRLLPTETVHHIDCDSFNNDPGNLYLFEDERAHQLAHASIERLVRPLLEAGVIEFRDGFYSLAVAVTASETRG